MAECSALNNLNIDEKEIKLSVHPEYTSYPMEPCFFCIDLKLTAPSLPLDGGVRAPIDLVAVIDRSGSMKGDGIELVKNVLSFIVSHLKTFDRLGIVMYDDKVDVIAPLTKMTLTNSATLNDRIDEINAGGNTNLSGGLFQGMSMMNERKGEKADVASVLLFTDGMANVGLTSTRTIIKAMKIMYGENKSFTINTFGFGSDHNVNMLREFSKTWNGLYYFIETTEQIPEIFTNCLGGILSTVAQNISLRIEACNGAKLKEIISKVPPNLSDENRKGEVPIGDIQAEEERDAIVEFHLPEMKKDSSCTSISQIYAKISVNYLNVIKKNLSTVSTEVSVPRSLRPASLSTSLEVDEQRNRIKATHALEKAAEIAEKGDLEKARNVIKDTQVEMDKSSNKSDMVSGINDDLDLALTGLSDKKNFSKFGKSILYSIHDSNLNQRHGSSDSYRTSSGTTAENLYLKYTKKKSASAPIPTSHTSKRIDQFLNCPNQSSK